MDGLRRATLCCVLAALSGCGDSSSQAGDASVDGAASGAGASASATPGSCDDFGGDTRCATCLANQCCPEAAACDTSSECVSLVACARECDPNATACRANCANDGPAGRGPYNELVLCMGEQCADECYFATP